jgi:hypothetical protein
MKNFAAQLLFAIHSPRANGNKQYDESLRLITAFTIEDALKKAQELGKQLEDAPDATATTWRFLKVTRLYELQRLQNGAELSSRIFEDQDLQAGTHRTQLFEHQLLASINPN